MSQTLADVMIGIVTVIYLIAAILYLFNSRYGIGIAYLFYAFANVGLILASKGI
jgi:hypothetical protein